jgi:hypothetical protein
VERQFFEQNEYKLREGPQWRKSGRDPRDMRVRRENGSFVIY